MTRIFNHFSTNATLRTGNLSLLDQQKKEKIIGYYTFIRALENSIPLRVDGVPVLLQPHQIISLTPIQHLQICEIQDAIVYQFNKEFYCIKDHDKEVSCYGLLFFGNETIPIISLNKDEQVKFNLLHEMILEELDTEDTIQAEMLRILLARFIIKTTRLLKKDLTTTEAKDKTLDTIRAFNILVETHFKEAHNVSFYANKLFKSPKTLSNTFSKFKVSPLQIIHERIILEAKRQLNYTDKTTKQIAYDIGFEDASHLSRMFKKQTGTSPTMYKKSIAAV
ncbi:AraC family transcriptional regulator [Patiriisocius marinistellae]|uniref:AraC family transcriptional regulator n=1 Tax=Patiriisocius marinistellae TaxID=2494560 RepID=A0A5J4FSI3_9FLAO|nr:helix-turn-helix domain-containing protein [Patiriisocius marinistellae]GEQ85057.1 AraC family transcriptional regulator [Patiriisocius marinistellae]